MSESTISPTPGAAAPVQPAGDPADGGWPGLRPGTEEVLRAGTSIAGGRPLTCDIIVERDIAVAMRDGITIYTDVLRPTESDALPALIAWSPYGKQDPGWLLNRIPNRAGIPIEAVSGLQKWEGPDPAYWCEHGYAVVQPRRARRQRIRGKHPLLGRR